MKHSYDEPASIDIAMYNGKQVRLQAERYDEYEMMQILDKWR
jgi:hypothetical protein